MSWTNLRAELDEEFAALSWRADDGFAALERRRHAWLLSHREHSRDYRRRHPNARREYYQRCKLSAEWQERERARRAAYRAAEREPRTAMRVDKRKVPNEAKCRTRSPEARERKRAADRARYGRIVADAVANAQFSARRAATRRRRIAALTPGELHALRRNQAEAQRRHYRANKRKLSPEAWRAQNTARCKAYRQRRQLRALQEAA